MVNTGKLSRGCERCRLRRVKCDEERPGCLRCSKIGTTCPGYRSLEDARFIDQTLAVRRRFASQVQLYRSPPESTEGYARQAYLRKFPDFYTKPRPEMNYWLFAAISRAPEASALSSAAAAIGAVIVMQDHPQVGIDWRKPYGRSLRRIRKSLNESRNIQSIDTALAIVVLINIETMQSSPSSSQQHSSGLAAILQEQNSFMSDEPNRQLLYQARDLMLVNSLQYGTAISPPLWTLCMLMPDGVDEVEAHINWLAQIIAQLCYICGVIALDSVEQSLALRQKVLTIDQELERWFESSPAAFAAQRVNIVEEGFPSYLLDREHPHLGRTVIMYRCARWITTDILYGFEPPAHIADLQVQLATDMCAEGELFVQRFGDEAFTTCGRLPQWPLFLAGSVVRAPTSLIDWILTRLWRLHAVGVKKAELYAMALAEHRERDQKYWLALSSATTSRTKQIVQQ